MNLKFLRASMAAAMMSLTIATANGNLYFTDQAQPATGTFEWDEFAGATFTAAHVPDVRNLGSGTATLAGVVDTIGFAPPPMVVPGVRDLYTGSAATHFNAKVDPAITADSLTTVVLQFTVAPEANIVPSSILLNGAAPTELVDRHIGPDDLRYYWAEWQLSAASPLLATFQPVRGPQGDHFVLYGAQLEYFNGSATFNAATPALVPEPTTLGLAGVGLAGLALRRRRSAS